MYLSKQAVICLSLVAFSNTVLAADSCAEFVGKWQCQNSKNQIFIEEIVVDGNQMQVTTNQGEESEDREIKVLSAAPRESTKGGFPLSIHTMLADYIAAKIPAIAGNIALKSVNMTQIKLDKIVRQSSAICGAGQLEERSKFKAVFAVTAFLKADVIGTTFTLQRVNGDTRKVDETISGGMGAKTKFSALKTGDLTPFTLKSSTTCHRLSN